MNPPVPIEPYMALGPGTSFVWVLVVGWAITILFGHALSRYFMYRGRVLRAQSISKRPPRLEEGPALLQGKVETDDGAPGVRIAIDQVGKETKNKNNYSHVWEERHRAIHVQPFRLRLPTDETVNVVPDERVRVVDDLKTERYEGIYRVRVAEVSSGEQVWVSGWLAREGQQGGATSAYRAGPGALVLRGSGSEPLEISSGSLDRQFSYWLKFYRWSALLLGIVWLVVQGLFTSYYLLLWTGKVVTADITRTSTYITTNKNSKTTHYVIHARLPSSDGGREVDDEVGLALYNAANRGLKKAPFLYSRLAPSVHMIGEHAHVNFGKGFGALVLTFVTMLFFFLGRRNARPWYEQKTVAERGSGRLRESAWHIQVAGQRGLFVPGKAPRQTLPREDDR